jgi:DNA-binding transcriptional ArsR family regulator
MAVSKKHRFEGKDIEIADGARALGHPARVAIIRLLAERSTCICGEIVDRLPLAQSTVSQHLKALKDAGLIIGTVDGPRSCFCLNIPVLSRLSAALDDLLADLPDSISCC